MLENISRIFCPDDERVDFLRADFQNFFRKPIRVPCDKVGTPRRGDNMWEFRRHEFRKDKISDRLSHGFDHVVAMSGGLISRENN